MTCDARTTPQHASVDATRIVFLVGYAAAVISAVAVIYGIALDLLGDPLPAVMMALLATLGILTLIGGRRDVRR